jgi:hypothetical protein
MNRFLLAAAILVISTSAFAQANSPSRKGDKCWTVTDQRGFGYWGGCSSGRDELKRRDQDYRDKNLDRGRGGDIGGMGNVGGGGGEGGR